jgi:hypothetical protein
MKNIRYILSMIIGCLVISSCQNDILDKKPLDIITEDVVWKDQTLIDAYLTNLYRATSVLVQDCSGLINGWNADALSGSGSWEREFANSEFGTGPMWLNEISDEAKAGWGYEVNCDGVKVSGLSVGGGFMEYWEAPYKVLRSLNDFIARVPDSPLADDFKKKRVAEARFLRAFNYFSMVKRYGGVPLITKVLDLNGTQEELYPARDSEQKIYDFIISEMDAVAADLDANSDVGRPNKYAALALECRAALYAGSIAQFGQVQLDGLLGIPAAQASTYYQKAYDCAMKIKQSGKYALYNKYPNDRVKNFRQLFMEKNNCEAIFVKQHDGTDGIQGTGNGWSWDFLECPKPQAWNAGNADAPYLEMAEEFEHIDGTSGKLDRDALPTKEWTMDELWKDKDPRFYATLWTNGSSFKGITIGFYPSGSQMADPLSTDYRTGFGVMKYLDENANNMEWLSRSSTDYQVFRYGEVLLNLAEAAFELGKTDEALNAINEIRDRAGITRLTSITRDAIRHERKVELAFEGHRYWDVRRWRIATTALSAHFSGLIYHLDPTTGKFIVTVNNQVHGNSTPTFVEKEYYFPITLGRTGQNPNLKENPGYE